MKTKLLALAMVTCLVFLVGCQSATPITSSSILSSAVSAAPDATSESLLSDDALTERVLYLLHPYTLPDSWWIGAGSSTLDIWETEFVEPLSGTPEGTTFYQVLRFNSIAEMKRSTEQIVTKEYANLKLYPSIEKNKQFLEQDGMLYMNTAGGAGLWPFVADSATVLSKTDERAILSVVFKGPGDEESVKEIEIKKENQTWKLNATPFTEN